MLDKTNFIYYLTDKLNNKNIQDLHKNTDIILL